MNRYHRRGSVEYRHMSFASPSTVASLPKDVYGDMRVSYEGPLEAEPPIFDWEKAEQRARSIAEEFRKYVVIEGAAVAAECEGEELEAELLELEDKG